MSLWIIKGSDFVDALKRAFQEHDQAKLDYLMREFSIADHGVMKRQRFKFIDGNNDPGNCSEDRRKRPSCESQGPWKSPVLEVEHLKLLWPHGQAHYATGRRQRRA